MISDPDGIGNVVGYDGYVFDVESGLDVARFRWYDPTLGRWLQTDPIGPVDGANLFLYACASPTDVLDPDGLYGDDGHYYATYIAARVCGHLTPARAYRLAYYAQLPDQHWRYDAINAGIRWFLNVGLNDFPLDVQNWLHSLHGGNPDQVRARQDCLKKLISDGKLKEWEKGFVIHALGDAYAHVKPNGWAYCAPCGHAGDGTAPDNIANDPDKFMDYMSSLCTSLGGGRSARKELRRILSQGLGDLSNVRDGMIREADRLGLYDQEPHPYYPRTDDVYRPRTWLPDGTRIPSRSEVQELIKTLKNACCGT
jgi:RHS repeat-associated protein